MMPGYNILNFNVLDRNLEINYSHFLEASAGTGKTFTLVHLALRFILERGVPLEKILIVTFTRASTLELVTRLRQLLQETLLALKEGRELPDYLEPLKENSQILIRRLQAALATFDGANIYTIHAFCHHILSQQAFSGDVRLNLLPSSQKEILAPLKDFLRTEVNEELLCPYQMQLLMRSLQGDFEALLLKVADIIAKRVPIRGGLSFEAGYQKFLELDPALRELPTQELLEAWAPSFRGLSDRKQVIKTEVSEAISLIATLLRKETLSRADFVELLERGAPLYKKMLAHERLPSRKPPLHFAFEKAEIFVDRLFPLLVQMTHPLHLIATLAERGRQCVLPLLAREEKIFFDDLLIKMAQNVRHTPFAQRVQALYESVFIDEFQDTDPLQWEIFSTLFAQKTFKGALYLVGDPKQSIYGFRNADIYTYLQAKREMSAAKEAHLLTNYRSHPELIAALNVLFCASPQLFMLPKIEQSITYLASQPSKAHFPPQRGPFKALHLFAAENDKKAESELFLFTVQEIKRLQAEGHAWNSSAVLVKDRYQAERFYALCQQHQVPAFTLRHRSLVDSKAFTLLVALFEALKKPSETDTLFQVLGGDFFGLDFEALSALLREDLLKSEVVKQFYKFKQQLEKEGAHSLFHHFLDSLFREKSPQQRLLAQPAGRELYHDLLQLVELIPYGTRTSEEALLFLEELAYLYRDEEQVRCRQEGHLSGVHILTLHASKGLEYDFIFPLGLVAASPRHKNLITVCAKGERFLLAPSACSAELALYEEELAAEKMRQFYVAATRARQRLYLPLILESASDSPMALFLHKLKTLYPTAASLAEAHPTLISYSHCQEVRATEMRSERGESLPLLPPPHLPHPSTPRTLSSFSSLVRFAEKPAREESLITTLPRGAAWGDLLHHILEEIDFTRAGKCHSAAELEPLFAKRLEKSPYFVYSPQIAEQLFTLFHTPLQAPRQTFTLAEIGKHSLFKELRFLSQASTRYAPPGLMQGVIDLFFEYQGLYYAIDWKSNLLASYTPAALKEEMQYHRYDLQATIYKEALKKYLALFSKERQFEGIFYLFLRGLPQEGVLFLP